ncbi:MAG: PilW family protein [Acidobacteria bacterium]|nr:PilW family protein [Acidobacteriota bacterium]MCA1609885.1 PilW family protein [Acidobacteriota bacterium]
MTSRRFDGNERGFTLIEMIIVVFLLAIAMLGILAVFDASARINKGEQEVADAQGAVRYGIYQMTRAVRMAGSGGLFVTQAVLNAADPQMGGVNEGTAGRGFDNVIGATVTDVNGNNLPVRDGTDMIEVRGVINSPLIGFDLDKAASGCGTCNAVNVLKAKAITGDPLIGTHVNNDVAQRPQFAAIDAYTLGAAAGSPRYVFVSGSDDIHEGCSVPFGPQRYPQPTYNVGVITAPTTLAALNSFGNVNFTDATAEEFGTETPAEAAVGPTPINTAVRRVGILDDLIFFIDNSDPAHPALAQGIRRGARFEVERLADDVEDMQIAYGVDANDDDAVRRTVANVAVTDTDRNVSTQANGDEWSPNIPGEANLVPTAFIRPPIPPGTPPAFAHAGILVAHCPRLHGVMISLVAKSKDPDPRFISPSALGFRTMNSPGTPLTAAAYPTLPGEPHFRRRVQTLKINLRNYAFPG